MTNDNSGYDNFQFRNIMDDESDNEFIPLLTTEDEEQMNSEQTPDVLSILPLRNTVLFPGVVIPITVGRDKSIKLIKDAYKADKIIGVVSQKDDKIEDPSFDELNKIGTVAFIIKMLRMPDGNTTVIIQGKKRFALNEITQTEPYLKASVNPFVETKPAKGDKEFDALFGSIKDLVATTCSCSGNVSFGICSTNFWKQSIFTHLHTNFIVFFFVSKGTCHPTTT